MVVVGDVRKPVVRRELKEGLYIARRTEVVVAASTSAARKARKAGRISASHMVEVAAAAKMAARELREGNLDYASSMEAARDAERKTA